MKAQVLKTLQTSHGQEITDQVQAFKQTLNLPPHHKPYKGLLTLDEAELVMVAVVLFGEVKRMPGLKPKNLGR